MGEEEKINMVKSCGWPLQWSLFKSIDHKYGGLRLLEICDVICVRSTDHN